MGLTGVSFRNYNLAHVGMLPGIIAYCFLGGTLGALGDVWTSVVCSSQQFLSHVYTHIYTIMLLYYYRHQVLDSVIQQY